MVTRRTPAWTSRRFLERELNALSQEIVHLSDVDQLADLLLERLGRTLRLSWAAITLEDEGSSDRRYCWGIPPNDYLTVPRFEPQFGDSPQLFFVDTELNGLAVQLIANGVRIGTVMLGAKQEGAEFLSTDIKLLRFLTPLAASALRNGLLVRRLEQQVKALADREQELRALGLRLMNVAEEERRRLALDLHDDPLQRAILLSREMRENPAAEQLDVWIRQVEEIAISLRATCQHVRPPALDDLGTGGGSGAADQ